MPHLHRHAPAQDELRGDVAPPLARKPGQAGSMIALQHTVGNRAVAQLLARDVVTKNPPAKLRRGPRPQPKPKTPTKKEPPPLDPNGDLAFALKYVDDY